MAGELSGKTAFVTGSGRGLGRVMAERLAENGADVAIHDMDWTQPAKYGEFQDLGEVASKLGAHGTNVNEVTHQRLTDMGNAPAFYDCLVQVEAA